MNLIIYILITLFAANSAVAENEKIEVGLIASLTGYGAASGNSTVGGAQLAVQEINAQGGIGGKKVILHIEDNQSEPKNGISAFYKLKSVNKIAALIGPNWTEFAEPVSTVADTEQIPMITPTGHSEQLLKNKPFVFSLLIPARDAIRPLSNYILSKKFTEIHILYSQNAFFEMISDALVNNLTNKINLKKELVSSNNLDFKTNIARLKNKKDTAIFALLQENGPVSTFVKQARSAGISADRIFLGPVLTEDTILKNDSALTHDIHYFDYVFTISDEFQKKYRAMHNTDARYDSTLAYDAIYMFKHSIEKCGSEAQKIITCIPTSLPIGQSGPISFDTERNRIMDRPVTVVLKMQNGVSIPAE